MKNNLLEELMTLVEQDTGAVAGFVGRKGQDVDKVFAGPFHPEFGELAKTLQFQLDRSKELTNWNEEETPLLDVLFRHIPSVVDDLKKAIDEPGEAYKLKDIVYDKNEEMSDEVVEKLKNNTNQWKPIWRE